jgi:hypothetical protein
MPMSTETMPGELVATRLFALERVLCLTRPHGGHETGSPAVLTIPRGGRPHEPRLLLFGERCGQDAARLGVPLCTDTHVVVYRDGRRGRRRNGGPGPGADADRRELADVLVDRALHASFGLRDRLRRTLDRYPGCSVAVGRRPGGQLAVAWDGSVVSTRCPSSTYEVWAPICGSFLYCWTAAGLAVAELSRTLLVVGRFVTSCGAGPGCLETMGRVQVTTLPGIHGAGRAAS